LGSVRDSRGVLSLVKQVKELRGEREALVRSLAYPIETIPFHND